ncbi:MAG: MerR family DNA-binding transcriptional regulator [Actinomycetota bacterium]
MRITAAAQRLGISPRMLRYRESLGLLPVLRPQAGWRESQAGGRQPHGGRREPQGGQREPQGGQREPQGGQREPQAGHRSFTDHDVEAVALALAIERRYDISPAALAFGLKMLTDPAARSQVAELGRRTGRIPAPATRALDFEKERAERLLSLTPGR